MKMISGGVCAAKGFSAGGVHSGIRKSKSKLDLALITCSVLANAASVYTTNLVKGAPILVTKENLANGKAQAVICNSGNANTCNANGVEIAKEMCALVEAHTGIAKSDVIVASTGVIGQELSIEPIKNAMDALVKSLGNNSDKANEAIMTTDTIQKTAAVEFELDGKICKIGGIGKGSGMICPNMATMLVFVTTDAKISAEMLQKAINADVKDSFNMVSVDGDTSTNDMLSVMASGLAGNCEIIKEDENYNVFCKALSLVTTEICKLMAGDGEGATKRVTCEANSAPDKATAKLVAKSVIKSNLLKAAMFGSDANWGRVLCAIGYSGANVDINKIDVAFASAKGKIEVCKGGSGIPFDEAVAKKLLSEKEVEILVSLNDGDESAVAWGCDLTYDYVKINGDYRT